MNSATPPANVIALETLGAQMRADFPDLCASSGALWLAYSGGLDSTVLLHLLVHLGVRFQAVHINHQLSPNAAHWQRHCETQCATLGVNCVSQRVTVKNQGRGVEDAARASRYQVFEQLLAEGGHLLTAHHQDDQAETLLLRQLRGAGVAGLAAMSARRPLAAGQLVRPLLAVSRAQLLQCARSQGLRWIEDESNTDAAFDRNYLRQAVMPLLRQRWPQVSARLAQSATHCQAAAALLTEVAGEDLPLLDQRPERQGVSIDLMGLAGLSEARRNNLLRHWLDLHRVTASTAQLAQLTQQWWSAAEDAQPALQLGAARLLRFQARGYLLRAALPEATFTAQAIAPGQVLQAGPARFCLRPAGRGLALPPAGHWWLRSRQAGDRCLPEFRQRSQTLKKCLQESALAPWWRPFVPVVCSPGDPDAIWAVADLWLDRRAPMVETAGYLPHWWFENPDF